MEVDSTAATTAVGVTVDTVKVLSVNFILHYFLLIDFWSIP
jgi:hypothetical protein